jgi:hypothetical protein
METEDTMEVNSQAQADVIGEQAVHLIVNK